MFKKIFQWFIYSSANPQNVALTAKMGVAFLVLLGVDKTLLDGAEETIVGVIVAFCILLTKMGALLAFLRKIILSFKK